MPHYPGIETFRGEQLHTVDYPGPRALRGRRVLVVGGGASAVQLLGEIAPVTDTVWVTRRPPVWRTDDFDPRGRAGPRWRWSRSGYGAACRRRASSASPGSRSAPQEREAERLGAYRRRPMFDRIEPDGVRWADGCAFEPVDVILWATGFRPAVAHLAPLRLRSPAGGIQLEVGGPCRARYGRPRPAGAARRLRAVGQHDRRQPGRAGRGGSRGRARPGGGRRPQRLSRPGCPLLSTPVNPGSSRPTLDPTTTEPRRSTRGDRHEQQAVPSPLRRHRRRRRPSPSRPPSRRSRAAPRPPPRTAAGPAVLHGPCALEHGAGRPSADLPPLDPAIAGRSAPSGPASGDSWGSAPGGGRGGVRRGRATGPGGSRRRPSARGPGPLAGRSASTGDGGADRPV